MTLSSTKDMEKLIGSVLHTVSEVVSGLLVAAFAAHSLRIIYEREMPDDSPRNGRQAAFRHTIKALRSSAASPFMSRESQRSVIDEPLKLIGGPFIVLFGAGYLVIVAPMEMQATRIVRLVQALRLCNGLRATLISVGHLGVVPSIDRQSHAISVHLGSQALHCLKATSSSAGHL